MADLHRLTRWLFAIAICVAWTWQPGYAGSIPSTSGGAFVWSTKGFSNCGALGQTGITSASAACDGATADAVSCSDAADGPDVTNTRTSFSTTGSGPTITCGWSWTWHKISNNTNGGGTVSAPLTGVATSFSCPSNATLDSGNSTCSCNSGFIENGTHTACVASNTSVCAGLTGKAPNQMFCTGESCRFYQGANPATRTVDAISSCDGTVGSGCTVAGNHEISSYDDQEKLWVVQTSGNKYTGGTCDPTIEPTPGATEVRTGTATNTISPITPDRVGKCPGTVNGTEVWVECSWTNSENTSTKNTASNPTGAASSTSSETSKTTTECKDGKCTSSTVTSTTVNGSVTGSVTVGTSTGKGQYCASNPGDPQCAGEGGWGGSCSAGFTCDGDAALCAAAKGVWEQKCALIDGPATPNAEQQAYAAAKAASGAGLTSTTTAISSSSFDSSNALGVSAQCITDRTVVVNGNSIVLPFSGICPYLATLGGLMQALAALAAMFIVFKRS
jgi:hypothetical protein